MLRIERQNAFIYLLYSYLVPFSFNSFLLRDRIPQCKQLQLAQCLLDCLTDRRCCRVEERAFAFVFIINLLSPTSLVNFSSQVSCHPSLHCLCEGRKLLPIRFQVREITTEKKRQIQCKWRYDILRSEELGPTSSPYRVWLRVVVACVLVLPGWNEIERKTLEC